MQLKKSLNNKGYTLAEMLVVIAIIGIIMGVAVTGIKKVAEGNPTVEALSIMKNSVNEAKKLAVGRGENVRLVIYTDSQLDGKELKKTMGRYLKYVGLAVNDGSGWKLVDKGNLLPKEAYFDEAKSIAGADGTISVEMEDGSTASCSYYEFSADGLIVDPPAADAPRIVVNEGRVRRANKEAVYTPADEGSAELAYRGFVVTRSGIAADISSERLADLFGHTSGGDTKPGGGPNK